MLKKLLRVVYMSLGLVVIHKVNALELEVNQDAFVIIYSANMKRYYQRKQRLTVVIVPVKLSDLFLEDLRKLDNGGSLVVKVLTYTHGNHHVLVSILMQSIIL